MATIKEQLLSTLNDLESEDLDLFQWHLKNSVEGFCCIPKAQLENASRHITVDKVVQTYGLDGAVQIALAILKKMNCNQLAEELRTKLGEVAAVQKILSTEPKTREDFLKYYCQLTLDPNTAHPQLILSEMNRVVTWSEKVQGYSDHPERFNYWYHVLSKESVCGRCYWEVERRGEGGVNITVSYKNINRKGGGYDCAFGCNTQSWSLYCSPPSLSFYHNNIETEIPEPPPSRIGVYVDHSAGTLSFYRVSDTMTLLYTVNTTFTHTLCAGFGVYFGSTVRLGDVK